MATVQTLRRLWDEDEQPESVARCPVCRSKCAAVMKADGSIEIVCLDGSCENDRGVKEWDWMPFADESEG